MIYTGSRAGFHDTYVEHAWRWRFWQLSYLGGYDYLNPDIKSNWCFAIPGVDGDGNASLHSERGEVPSFIQPHDREEDWTWEQRKCKAYFRNLTRPIVDTYASHAVTNVDRKAGNAPILEDVWRNVNGAGLAIDRWAWNAAVNAQVFGHVIALVDMPRLQPGEILSLADQRAAELKPFVSLFTPLEVPDWECDRFGEFEWIKIAEADMRSGRQSAADQYAAPGVLFRVWYKDKWELWESGDGDATLGKLIDSGPNPIGRVPATVFYSSRKPGDVGPIGQSRISDISELNKRIFNLDSKKDQLIDDQGFPFLAIPDPNNKLSRVDVGTKRAFAYDPEGGLPVYVAPSAEWVVTNRDEVADLVMQIRAMAGLSRGISESSMSARSGDAILYESQDKAAMLLSLAHEFEDGENRLAKLIAAWSGVKEWDGSVRYPDEYNVKSLGEELDELIKYNELMPPASAKAAMLEGVTKRMLRRMPEVELDAIVGDIHAHAEEEEEKQAKAKEAQEAAALAMEAEGGPAFGKPNPVTTVAPNGD